MDRVRRINTNIPTAATRPPIATFLCLYGLTFIHPIPITTFLTCSASLVSCIMVFSMLSSLLVWLLLLSTCAKSLAHQNRTNELKVTSPGEAYGHWVSRMGSLKHSLFQKAKNKLRPCLKLKVHKDPKKGDFTQVQAAINSLPMFSHCRVVIRISHGIYR